MFYVYICLCVLRAKPSIKWGVSFLLNRQPTRKNASVLANALSSDANTPVSIYTHHIICLRLSSASRHTEGLSSSKDLWEELTTASRRGKTYTKQSLAKNAHMQPPPCFQLIESKKRKLWFLHDDALLFRVHLAVLVDAGHVFVVALLGLDLVWEPFLQKGGEFLV